MADEATDKEKVTINLHSGSYDRAANALSLATICLAMGMEAHILLTYEALRRFVNGHLEDMEGIDTEIKESFQRGLASGGISSIGRTLAEAKKLGLKLYACPGAMANLNISRQDLIDEVDEVMGLAAFVGLARTAKINWYI